MLFNSPIFILGFLPIVLLLYLGLEYLRKPAITIIWLFIASLFFPRSQRSSKRRMQ